jgi:ATP-binding cassette subfamily F protein 3
MIQVENLSISHGGNKLFEDVAFTIVPGERCGLVGRNGSGKTTLLRLIMGKEVMDSGNVSFSKGYHIGYLDQHIRFTCPTVLEEAALGLKEDDRDSLYKAEKILFGLGFTEKEIDTPPQQLSGGYSLRLHLTKVLLSEPDCLLLDEPTNYLDILSLRFLMGFLKQWKGELILISHDREFMDAVTTHTLGIHRKKVRKVKGSTIDFFNQILQEEEVYERTRMNVEKKKAHLQSYVDRFGAKASKAGQASSRKKMLARIPALEGLKSLYHLDFNFHEFPFNGNKLMDAKEISFSYNEPLIHDFSLTIERGERIAIIGKNGYGKSTLLRLISQELTPKQGDIKFSEKAVTGYFGQTNIQRLHPAQTIEDEIATANTALAYSQVKQICGQMMFSGDQSKKKIGVLSGGEKSRVLLGKILAKPCNLLLLDEPTHHLDIESVEALIDALEEFSGAFVIVTHSELILKRLDLDKLIVCHSGKHEVFEGNYEDFLDKIGWEEEGPKKKPKAVDYKEDKRKKADLVGMRSKVLKPLETEIQRLEKAIVTLEKDLEKEQHLLVQESQKGNKPKIQELLRTTGEKKKEIDKLFEKLTSVSEEFESKKKEYS